MSDIDVPLDAPIPTTAALYCWSAAEGCWLTWTDYVFREARRNMPARSGEPAPAARASRSVFQEELYASGT